MKFERLTVPDWPLPDLVAFNRKVHEWVDPWWARRWVRFITWAGRCPVHAFRRDLDLFRERSAVVGNTARLSAAAPDQHPRL